MATYTEIRGLFTDDSFRNRCTVATVIAAHMKLTGGTPTADEVKWASAVLASPDSEGRKAQMAVLAANNGADTAVILSATDAQIQTNVDAVVDSLVVAFNAV